LVGQEVVARVRLDVTWHGGQGNPPHRWQRPVRGVMSVD
jgi:hypothetical protein